MLPIGSRPIGSTVIEFILSMTEIAKKFGKRIRMLREKKGLTQEALAFEADLHRAYVGQIERGEKTIGLENLEKLAKALKLTPARLLDFK